MSDTFKIKLSFVVLTTDIPQNKQYVLSLNKEKIELPSFYVTKENVENINDNIIKYLRELVFVDKLELMPQIISLNEKQLPLLESDTINVVYGSIIRFSPSLNNCYWKSFNYFTPNDYNDVILKTVQRFI